MNSTSSDVTVSGGESRTVEPWVSLARTPWAASRSHRSRPVPSSSGYGDTAPQPHMGEVFDSLHRFEPSPHLGREAAHIRLRLAFSQNLDYLARDGRREWVATECRAVLTGPEHAQHVTSAHNGRYRNNPSSEGFSERHEVRLDAPQVAGKGGTSLKWPGSGGDVC